MNTLELTAQTVNTLEITELENRRIDELLSSLMEKYPTPSNHEFLQKARVYAAQLPERILFKLNEFRFTEYHKGLFLLSGLHINQEALGNTPNKVGRETDEMSGAREGYLMILLASFLGEPMGWNSQRNGALINNIVPLEGHTEEQLSTGSTVELDWHTEEAFHPCRADYLALLCMRNPDAVATRVASIADVVIPDNMKQVLFQERFIFLTDKNFEGGPYDHSKPQQVLFGDFQSPYMKIDPSFMHAVEGDTEAAEALNYISKAIEAALFDVALEPGQMVFLDNYRVVHGRKPFTPRFDGNDRWLKRINITLDLRKSRTIRTAHDSRVLLTN
ncbi:MAG: TauD/TfdA family dioxygenase [Dinghuibacter sp.]|nr:TauD/TfdA family dioxygenase [Dinghuibacter sp.]